MALVERVMQWRETEPRERYIPVHEFFAAMNELAQGYLTVAQLKNFLNMTPEDENDFDQLVANAPNTNVGKALYIESVHAVFLLATRRYPNYSTPQEIRLRLGII